MKNALALSEAKNRQRTNKRSQSTTHSIHVRRARCGNERMKDKKAPGLDEIRTEQIKNFGQ